MKGHLHPHTHISTPVAYQTAPLDPHLHNSSLSPSSLARATFPLFPRRRCCRTPKLDPGQKRQTGDGANRRGMGKMQVGASREKKCCEQSGRAQGTLGPSVLQLPAQIHRESCSRLPGCGSPKSVAPQTPRKGRCGRLVLLAPNFRNPTHPQEPDAFCPWAQKPGWRNFGGDRDSPEGDPDAAGKIRGPRREAEIGCRDAALATVQRRLSFPGGAESPLRPGPNSAPKCLCRKTC